MTSAPTTVLDGVQPEQAVRDGMSQTTYRATRPERSRFVSTPATESHAPAEQAQPARRIQIGPTDV
ncbi:hypothetical protein [Pandoraea norimbergensis]|uniref:Uncharacterized protein n=1 Tax=Pandoraea norimbergensis TaxID=93219 RepID=A0ABM5WNU9_9BURK|nr:hypothetical protein [Pandoraea norimbergensis]ALS62287.1 hypothetical protein AT302_23355 [Pandoraea norimbergensis]